MAAIALAKLVFIAQHEVVAEQYDPGGYAFIAEHWYWGLDYGVTTSYYRQPGFPLFIAVIHALGIPFRLGVEGCFLIGCFTLCMALWPRSEDGAYRIAAFALMVFQPAAVTEFCRIYPDGAYCAVLTFAVGCILLVWRSPGTRPALAYSFAAGAAFALCANMRQETVLIFGLLAVCAGVEAAGRFFGWVAGPWKQRVVCLLLIPFVCIEGTFLAVKAANYSKIGAFVTNDMTMPGFKNLYRAILRIQPDHPAQYICAPLDVRQKAYRVSKTFEKLKPYFEGPASDYAKEEARKCTGVGDHFAGNLIWVLRAWSFSYAADLYENKQGWRSAAEADSFFQRAADEINSGIEKGIIPGRFVFSSFVDPDFPKYLPQLPGMIMKFGNIATVPTLNEHGGPAFFERFPSGNFCDDPSVDIPLFNRMATRRAALVEDMRSDQRPLELQHRSWNVRGPMHWFRRINSWVVRLAVPAFLLAFIVSLRDARARVPGAFVQWAFCLALAYLAASRFLLFSVAALVVFWPIWTAQRYLLPAMPIIDALFVFCGSILITFGRRWWRAEFA